MASLESKVSCPKVHKVAIVGCGGTGSLLAEKLMRLLTGTTVDLILIDHDEVEPHNLLRQGFYEKDLGKNKALTLAERLARNFRRKVTAIPEKASAHNLNRAELIIGCVDNAKARRTLDELYKPDRSGLPRGHGWYIDVGNSENTGQLLIGNATADSKKPVTDYYREVEGINLIQKLPTPGTQQPGLLIDAVEEYNPDRDCAMAVMLQEQDPAINDAMATLANNTVYRLVTGRCNHMAQYLNLEFGNLTTIAATPENIKKVIS